MFEGAVAVIGSVVGIDPQLEVLEAQWSLNVEKAKELGQNKFVAITMALKGDEYVRRGSCGSLNGSEKAYPRQIHASRKNKAQEPTREFLGRRGLKSPMIAVSNQPLRS